MTDKTETALDLDGLMREGYRDYEAECAIAGAPVTLHAERIAFEAGWNYLAQATEFLAISQREEIARLKKDKADAIFFASKLEDELTRLKAENTELKERL